MKLPAPISVGVTTSGGILARVTIDVSGVMLTESTEFRELTAAEIDLVAEYVMQLVTAMLDGNQGEIKRLEDLLRALRAKPKSQPTMRGGHAPA